MKPVCSTQMLLILFSIRLQRTKQTTEKRSQIHNIEGLGKDFATT